MRANHLKSVFLTLLLFTGSVFAQSGTISGKVRDAGGATLTGVIVALWRANGLEAQSVTARDGDFEFSGLEPASYELIIKHPGYEPATERVEFRYFERSNVRMEIIRVEINLKPARGENTRPGTNFVQDVPPAARSAFENGVARIKEGKPIEGVALLHEAISVFPNYFNAHFALAGQLSREGKASDALAELELARLINDRDARVYHLFGVLMTGQSKYATAEWAFRAAIDRDPTGAQSHLSRAIVLLELAKLEKDQAEVKKRLTEAEGDLARVIELTGDKLPAAYLHRARIHEMRGHGKAAAADLETYLKRNPNDKNALALREAIVRLNR
ncbi:MAG: carboxypeptidase regulatory-like domain-containing protein [Acidobacteriota bacterium]